jgi:hypothetical protein
MNHLTNMFSPSHEYGPTLIIIQRHEWEAFMTTLADLTANIAALADAVSGIKQTITDLEGNVSQVRNSSTSQLSQEDQAALDAANATIQQMKQDLASQATGGEAFISQGTAASSGGATSAPTAVAPDTGAAATAAGGTTGGATDQTATTPADTAAPPPPAP